jgi:hypothetical protein
MAVDLAKYRKAVVASVGAAVIIVSQVFNVAVPDAVDDSAISVFDAVVAFLTAVGVQRVPNDT